MKKLLAALFFAMSVAPAAMANIVVNPGFEDGNVSWEASMGIGAFGSPNTNSGNWSAGTGCVGHPCVSTQGTGAFVRQTLNTVVGTLYDLSFFVGENAGPTSEMSVFWNGILVADISNPANNSINISNTFVQYSWSDLLATSNFTVLEVHGRQDPAAIFFDDFSVVASATVPEPTTVALLGLGLLGVAASRRKSAKK